MYRISLCLLAVSVACVSAAVVRQTGPASYEVAVSAGRQVSGPVALRNTLLKYGAELPSHLLERSVPNATVPATPESYDEDYVSPAVIGSLTYSVVLDTGGSTVSVYAPKLGKPDTTVTTSVSLGGLTVARQAVQLNDDQMGTSNVVGMSPTGGSYYANLIAQGSVAAVFTADLNKGAAGKFGIGFIDPTAYTGSITYVPVDTSLGYWLFNPLGVAIGNGPRANASITAIVDTGTSLIYLPTAVVTAYYSKVSGAVNNSEYGGYVFPCSATLPNLIVEISASYNATVPGPYLNFAPVVDGSTTCFGGLQSDTGIGFSILGVTFIKSQFVVFKGTKSASLGFAVKA